MRKKAHAIKERGRQGGRGDVHGKGAATYPMPLPGRGAVMINSPV